ncbi:hypothetical protein PSPO01_08720 [Paraphaeosphaeria sporulosa]
MRPRVAVAMDRAQHGSLSCSSDPSSHESSLLPQIPRSVAAGKAVTVDGLGGEPLVHTSNIPVLLAVTRPARLPCRGCFQYSRPDWWTRKLMHAAAGWPFHSIPINSAAGANRRETRSRKAEQRSNRAHYPPSPLLLASAI